MEKKKNNLMIVVIVLIILILGLGGYILYDKVLKTDNENNLIDNNHKNDENYISNFYSNMSKEKKIQEFSGDDVYGIVDTEGNVYFNTTKSISSTINLVEKEYEIDGYIAQIGSESNVFRGYKMNISNVINPYFSYVGNGGSGYVFLIKSDGSVGYIKIDKLLDGISIKMVDTIANLTNIVSFTNIYHVDTSEFAFVDIDGHILSVHNYDLD